MKTIHILSFADSYMMYSVVRQSVIIFLWRCTKPCKTTSDTFYTTLIVLERRLEVLRVYWTLSDIYDLRISCGVLYHNNPYWANGDSSLPGWWSWLVKVTIVASESLLDRSISVFISFDRHCRPNWYYRRRTVRPARNVIGYHQPSRSLSNVACCDLYCIVNTVLNGFHGVLWLSLSRWALMNVAVIV